MLIYSYLIENIIQFVYGVIFAFSISDNEVRYFGWLNYINVNEGAKGMKFGILHKMGFAILLAAVSGVVNASIVRTYDDVDGSGLITYTDLGNNQLQIDFDNTSTSNMSSIINGLVFDIDDDINAISFFSFVDGNGTDLSSAYDVELDVKNNITPGNTKVDLSIKTTTGIHGGIYNDAGNSGDLNNAFPDIATLILTISDPDPWVLNSIDNDILRLQRTGTDGNGSLKLSGVPAIPVPAAVWLFGSGLLGLVGIARRKSRA